MNVSFFLWLDLNILSNERTRLLGVISHFFVTKQNFIEGWVEVREPYSIRKYLVRLCVWGVIVHSSIFLSESVEFSLNLLSSYFYCNVLFLNHFSFSWTLYEHWAHINFLTLSVIIATKMLQHHCLIKRLQLNINKRQTNTVLSVKCFTLTFVDGRRPNLFCSSGNAHFLLFLWWGCNFYSWCFTQNSSLHVIF